MQEKTGNIKEILIAAALCLVLYIPCLPGAFIPLYAVLPLLIIAPLFSFVSAYRPYVVSIMLVILSALLAIVSASIVPLLGAVFILPAILTAGYNIGKENKIYNTILYVFYAILATMALLMLSARLYYGTDIVSLITDNFPSLFGQSSDYVNKYILMFDYASGGVTLGEYNAFVQSLKAIDSSDLYRMASPIVRDALNSTGLYVLLAGAALLSIYNSIVASFLSSLNVMDSKAMKIIGFYKHNRVIPSPSGWYLPQKLGRIMVLIFGIFLIAALLGVPYAYIPVILLSIVFIFIGLSAEWFMIRLMTQSRASALVMFFVLLLCLNFTVLLILGIMDSVMQFRDRYNRFLNSQNPNNNNDNE